MVDRYSETAYLICRSCAWVFPLATTCEDERCTQCEGELVVVDDHDLPATAFTPESSPPAAPAARDDASTQHGSR